MLNLLAINSRFGLRNKTQKQNVLAKHNKVERTKNKNLRKIEEKRHNLESNSHYILHLKKNYFHLTKAMAFNYRYGFLSFTLFTPLIHLALLQRNSIIMFSILWTHFSVFVVVILTFCRFLFKLKTFMNSVARNGVQSSHVFFFHL